MKKDYQVLLDLAHNEIPAIVNIETGKLTIIENFNKITTNIQELLDREVNLMETNRLVTNDTRRRVQQ